MILAIDCGNTHVTFGGVDGHGTVEPILRIPTDRSETDFGYAAKINQTLTLCGLSPSDFEGAAISCVVPPLTDVLVRAVRILTGHTALVVGAGVKTGLHIAINDPGTIASDLVAAAVAVKEEYPLPCVVVDMGTATTVTVVDEKARYIGGAILPGTHLSQKALSEGTALLPHINPQPPRNAIASTTVESMKSGMIYGSAGAIDGLLDRFADELGRDPASIVATGGVSRLVCPYCRHTVTIDEKLLLKGLWLIWKRNQK